MPRRPAGRKRRRVDRDPSARHSTSANKKMMHRSRSAELLTGHGEEVGVCSGTKLFWLGAVQRPWPKTPPFRSRSGLVHVLNDTPRVTEKDRRRGEQGHGYHSTSSRIAARSRDVTATVRESSASARRTPRHAEHDRTQHHNLPGPLQNHQTIGTAPRERLRHVDRAGLLAVSASLFSRRSASRRSPPPWRTRRLHRTSRQVDSRPRAVAPRDTGRQDEHSPAPDAAYRRARAYELAVSVTPQRPRAPTRGAVDRVPIRNWECPSVSEVRGT